MRHMPPPAAIVQAQLIPALIATMFMVRTVCANPIPEALPKDLGAYYSESFENSATPVYICILSSDESNSKCFLQLRSSPSKRVIASLKCNWHPGFSGLWNRSGKYIAISYRSESGDTRTSLYAASLTSLREISMPTSLKLSSLLPNNDPAWRLQKCAQSTSPVSWVDDTTLKLNVEATFRDVGAGYTDVAYEAIAKVQPNLSLKVISSKLIAYAGDE
jgi:hypothetical protein